MKDFGILIKTLRKEVGLTQRELADKLGIDDSNISKWERGKALPDVSIIPQIAALLNITGDELLHPAETLQKMNNSSNRSTLSRNDYTDTDFDNASEPVIVTQSRILFTPKRVCFSCIIAIVLVMSIFVYDYTQTKFTFVKARTNVETPYGPAYELVYYHKTKYPTHVFEKHACDLQEAWKKENYSESSENLLIVSYYLSIDSVESWDKAYQRFFYLKNPLQ